MEEKKHGLIFKIWRVIYPLLIFLGIQLISGIIVSVYYLVTVMLPGISGGMDPVTAAQQLQDYMIGQSLIIALICDALLIPLFAFLYLRQMKGRERPGLASYKIADYALVAALAVFADFVITFIIVGFDLAQYFPDYELILSGLGSSPLLLQIIAVGIVAPVAEEFLMRGVILNRLLGYVRVIPAILIQAALFGILHMNILQGLYAAVLGILMGYVYVKYGSLVMAILFHITLNTLSVLLPESLAEGINPFAILIPALLLTAGTIWMISRRNASVIYIRDRKTVKVLQEE